MRLSPLFVPLEYIINLDEKILDSIPAEYFYIITSNGTRIVEAEIAMCVDPKKRFPAINIINFIETVMAHYPIKKKSQDYAKIIFSSDIGDVIDSIIDEIQEYTKDKKEERKKVYTISAKGNAARGSIFNEVEIRRAMEYGVPGAMLNVTELPSFDEEEIIPGR